MTASVVDPDPQGGESEDAVIARMLEPLSDDNPAGTDMREDTSPQSAYYRLRDLRSEARAEERAEDDRIVIDARPGSAWRDVATLSADILATRSKDIEIASWLTEALTRTRGLDGLALGARIIAGLADHFWERGLYPAELADDPGGRTAAVEGLSGSGRDGSLMQPLRKLVLFELSDGAPVALWQYERARSVAALAEAARKQQIEKAGALAFDVVETAAAGVGRAALVALGARVGVALRAWRELEAVFERLAGADGPATGRVGNVLANIERIVQRHVPAHMLEPAETLEASPPVGAVSSDEQLGDVEMTLADGTASTGSSVPRPQTRDDLLDEILRIAVLFRNNEPNSPLSYTLEEAVRRARLPLPDLLRELLPELPPRINVMVGLGMRPPNE